jgi:hypothetical protein
MIIITNYRQEERNGKIYIRSGESSTCPVCSSGLKVIGSRPRKVTVKGNPQVYVIRRLKCKECRKIHHELPDLLVPYKRHSVQTIEAVITEHSHTSSAESHSTGVHRTTVKKVQSWWSHVTLQFGYLRQSLEARYDVDLSALAAVREIVRAFVNTHSWVQTRSAL